MKDAARVFQEKFSEELDSAAPVFGSGPSSFFLPDATPRDVAAML